MSGQRADQELIERVQAGDARAVGELFTRYWRCARAAAYGVTRNWPAAEDAASEGFLRALAGIGSLADAGRFAPWLRTIVVRAARAAIRNPAAAESAPESLCDEGPGPDDLLLRRQTAAVVHLAMNRLPEALRETIALHYFEGYGSADAARFLDVPPGTLRRRLHDGRELLRAEVQRILKGRKQMEEALQQQLAKFDRMISEGRLDRAMREILALRTPPPPLLDLIRNNASGTGPGSAGVARMAVSILESLPGFASDPHQPVGAAAQAIRAALPEFKEWRLDIGPAAERFFGAGEYRDRLQALLPPGFAEGRPGSFVRAARGLLHLETGAATQSVNSPSDLNNAVFSEVLDLTWMVAGPLDLRAVHEKIERLTAEVLPGITPAFSGHHEPRYRSALRLDLAGAAARAAIGGVLAGWPGHPPGMDAAHVRIYLEPWASLRSGQPVPFRPIGS